MTAATSTSPDVIVVGGGLIGCSIALRLARAKARVSVVEAGQTGCEASSAAAGMIAPQGETTELDEFYELCAASRDLYPAFAEEIEELGGRSVGFHRGGTLLAALDDSQADELGRIYEAQSQGGLPVERLTAEEARRRAPELTPAVRAALLMRGDTRVDNEELMRALADACRNAGVILHTSCRVAGFDLQNGRVEGIEVREGAASLPVTYSAGVFVLAAGAWSGGLAEGLGIRIPVAPCRGQLVEFDRAADFPLCVRAGHHYLVPRSGGRLVAGSTMEYAGFDKAVTGGGLRSILEAAERMAPGVRELRFRRAWAGLRPDTADHLPVLGYGEMRNLVFATGHFRNGILLAPITGKIISELVLNGAPSVPLNAYSPARFGG